MLTFAIGDVHGCRKELEALVVMIETFFPEDKHPERKFVFVGDYIDRGPDSKGVIDLVIHLQGMYEVHALRGNHEQMALDSSHSLSHYMHWMSNGGSKTLESFGGKFPTEEYFCEYFEWMNNLPYYYDDGKRFFVHAGVNKKPPQLSDKETMLWVRQPFISTSKSWGRYIVHGHTPVSKVTQTKYRCNIDTGCVFLGGKLTCAIFNDQQVEPIDFLQVEPIK